MVNNENSKMLIDKPHQPYGKHVDIITPFGQGADKMRINPQGEILSHEMILKGGNKIDLNK